MMEEFGYKSVMQVPKLEKIVISQGLGDATADKKIIGLCCRRTYSYHRTKGSWYYL